ncbi:hypothetical protein [Flavobacterium sp. J27]|uniref:hypothetical protein n=1 Tax=Flavobacterium sp. J27 TaxID=2060419 RepID=UPI00102F5ADE|nr:hypothetical protein [Flavobacterium sp. J27]
MLKKIILSIIAFILGITLALLTDSFFRHIIQTLFVATTFHKINFVGKDFHFFSSALYYNLFGLAMIVVALDGYSTNIKQLLQKISMSILIFAVAILGISTVEAHLKIIECTACDEGYRNLHWNDINYEIIVLVSLFLAIIPNSIRLVKRSNFSLFTAFNLFKITKN